MYVAMTRARRRLCVSYVATGADAQPATASRFLRDLPADETVVVRATHYEMRHAATDASGAAFALPNAPTPRGGGGDGYGGFGRTPGGGTAMSPRVAPADLGASSDLAARLGTWQGRAQQREDKKRAAAEKKKQPPAATTVVLRTGLRPAHGFVLVPKGSILRFFAVRSRLYRRRLQ